MLFMQMVFQLSSLATMLLGKVPNPETGETRRDLEAAQMLIDQLDMLEAKTKGNLTKEEEQLLRQQLTSLRMAYVEEVNRPQPPEEKKTPAEQPTEPAPEPPAAPQTPEASAEPAPGEESKKRFTKKY